MLSLIEKKQAKNTNLEDGLKATLLISLKKKEEKSSARVFSTADARIYDRHLGGKSRWTRLSLSRARVCCVKYFIYKSKFRRQQQHSAHVVFVVSLSRIRMWVWSLDDESSWWRSVFSFLLTFFVNVSYSKRVLFSCIFILEDRGWWRYVWLYRFVAWYKISFAMWLGYVSVWVGYMYIVNLMRINNFFYLGSANLFVRSIVKNAEVYYIRKYIWIFINRYCGTRVSDGKHDEWISI